MAKIKSCGFLIVTDDPNPSFLLMRHPHRWDLPKGHVDPGETNLQCALRELEEETGITADDIEVDPEFKYKQKYLVNDKRYDDNKLRKKKLIIYLAKLIRPIEIHVTEHTGYQWFEWNPPHDIQQMTINPLLEKLSDHWNRQENAA